MNEKKVKKPFIAINPSSFIRIDDPETLTKKQKTWLLSYMRKSFPTFFKKPNKK